MTSVTIKQPNGDTFRGCEHLAEWWPLFNRLAVKRGLVKQQVDVSQGSYNGTKVAASAGTHSGGGVWDSRQYSPGIIKLGREAGAAYWYRRYTPGLWPAHGHGILIGCPCNGPARYQVDAYKAGYNGLGAGGRGGKDDGPRVTIRTYHQGIEWMREQLGDKPKPAPSPAPKPAVKPAAKLTISPDEINAAIREDKPKSGRPVGPRGAKVKAVETSLSRVKTLGNSKRTYLASAYVDGHAGSTLEDAIKLFQRERSSARNPSGKIGPLELARLRQLDPKATWTAAPNAKKK